MSDEIPTKEEQRETIHRIWVRCWWGAAAVAVVSGGALAFMFAAGIDSKKVTEYSTAVFQVIVLVYGMAFFVPAFLTSLKTMFLGLDMSRHGIELGHKTSMVMDDLKKELLPILKDSRKLMDDLKALVRQFEEKNPKAIIAFLEKVTKDGTIDRVLTSIEEIGKRMQDLHKERKSVLSREDLIPGPEPEKLSTPDL